MRVLIVHDRNEAAAKLEAAIKALEGSISVTLAQDYVSAMDRMSEQAYDLAIVDLTLPHRAGRGVASHETADYLITEIFQSERICPPGDIIGVTCDPAALQFVANSLSGRLMALIEETQDSVWIQRICEKVLYISRASSARLRAISGRYDVDALLLCALDKEFAPFRDELDFYESQGVYYFSFADKQQKIRNGVAYAIGRSGQHAAASSAQSLITRFRPRLCLMSGFCGAIQDKAALGDIVVFESVIDWDSGKWKAEGGGAEFFARPEPIGIRDSKIHRVVRDMKRLGLQNQDEVRAKLSILSKGELDAISILIGPAASGSAVVAEKDVIQKIKGLNEDIKAVDMESYGFYFAAKYTHSVKPEFVCIKVAADFCDLQKDDRLHAAACYLSAQAVMDVITHHWDFAD